MKYISLIILSIIICFSASAQKERKFIREGNDLFHKSDFEKSEVEYRKALNKKDKSFMAKFNLGDALYKQKKYDEALEIFESLSAETKDKNQLADVYHNLGNTYLAKKKLKEAIEAYKSSLRSNPTSKDTKYNLEWARQQKKKQDQKNKDNKKNKDKNKDKDKKDKDKKNKDNNKKEENKKDQKKKDQDKKDQKKKDQDKQNKENKNKQQAQKNKISKDDAKRLLEALQNDEKKVQAKVKKAKAKAQKAKKIRVKKDW